MLRFLSRSREQVLQKYGTQWLFDAGSREDLTSLLVDASFAQVRLVDELTARTSSADESDTLSHDAAKLSLALEQVGNWPRAAKEWVMAEVAKEGGAERVIRVVVDDGSNYQGLKEKSVAGPFMVVGPPPVNSVSSHLEL